MQNIYEDQSVLINEITPNNFENAINKLKPLFNTASIDYTKNILKLKKLVQLKDEISRFIWYILTGGLVVSLSNMGIVTTKCEKDVKQMSKEVNAYNKAIKENSMKEKQQKQNQQKFYIRE